MNHDVFISYSSKNSAAAHAICHELEDNGIKCWMAPRDIPVGAKYASVITKAIVGCRIVVLVFSDDSARSPWVESEINIAFSNRKIIVPYKIDTARIEDYDEFYLMLNNRHWIEAYPDYKICFKELVEIVAQTLGVTIASNKTAEPVEVEQQPSMGTLMVKADLDCRVLNYGREIGVAKAGEYTTFELPLGDNELMYIGIESDEDCYEESITLVENRQKSVKVALLDKYNARKKEEAEKRAKAEREAYLLGLADNEFVQFKENGKYGYKLKSSGEIVVPLKYNFANSFREGLAVVRLNGKDGFIDKTGKEVIPLKYDGAESFSEGLAAVELNGKYSFIDKTGKEVIPLKYNYAHSFSEGLAAVKLGGKWGFIDKTGREIVPLKYDNAFSFREGLVVVRLNGKYSFIDKTGREIVPLKYDDAFSFSEGLAKVRIGSYSEGKYGFIDKTGKEVIPLKYDGAESFSEGLAAVELNGKYSFIDKTGKEVIPLKYDYVGSFSEGLAAVKLGGKWGFIDKTGKEVISLKYDYAGPFSDGLATVKLNGKWGFIDKAGKEVISLKYDDAARMFENGKAKVKLNGEWFFIDKNGNRVK